MGVINVYTGPMKCGKSKKIFDELDRQLIAGKKVQMFKPALDNRFGESVIASRSGKQINAINIKNIEEIANYDAEVYFIDEFQFLEGNLSAIEKLAGCGKKFYIAGLNLTAEKKTFGKMGDLLCLADNVNMLTAICEECRCENAIFSFYKGQKDKDIMLGNSEYLPVCRSCFDKLTALKNANI